MSVKLIQLVTLTLLITLPFGYWRFKTRLYSLAWFLSIHAPIPICYLIRKEMGLSFYYLPVITLSLILGHVLGARLHKILDHRPELTTTACLFMDVIRSALKKNNH